MNKSIAFVLVGIVIGVAISFFVFRDYTVNNMTSQSKATPTAMMNHSDSMTMEEMVGMLKGKSGDDFDKAFIAGMIEHHEGAVDMAEEAKKNAKHEEIKQMADDIISAQTKEIEIMKSWEKAWGYNEAHH